MTLLILIQMPSFLIRDVHMCRARLQQTELMPNIEVEKMLITRHNQIGISDLKMTTVEL